MRDHSTSRAERAQGGSPKAAKKRAYFSVLAVLLMAPLSAWAGDRHGETMVASILPPIVTPAPGVAANSMSAVFKDGDRIASPELAAQRGGAGAVVPITSAPQTVPQIILWDELKTQLPNGANQGTNRITIQVR